MWWGDLVSYRDWSETWMSESFATYGEYLFSRHDLGEDEGALNLLHKKESYLREAHSEYVRPIVFRRWEHQLRHDDVVGWIWAAGELGPFQADPEALAALRVAAVEDAFWAVREAATRTLGRSAGRDEREMLERLAATDASSKVRVAALEALGRNADSSLAGFFVERFEKDDSYLAQAEALRCLGRAGDVSHRRRLEAAAELRSPRDVLRSAAQDALAELAASE